MPSPNIVLLAVLAASSSVAQVSPDRASEYVPLHVGDVWVYDYASERCSGFTSPGGCVQSDTTLTYRVTALVLEGADTLAVVAGPDGSTGLYGLRSDGLEFAHGSFDQARGAFPSVPETPEGGFESALSRAPIVWAVDVGGTTYDLEVAVVAPPVSHVYARGIGLVEYRFEQQQSGGRTSTVRWRLRAAAVGGRTYGAFVTITDPAVEAATVAAFPNPTASRTTLRVEAPSPGVLEVAVFDLLGRGVWTAARTVREGVTDLEVGLETLPAGVYLVRSVFEGAALPSLTVTKR